MPTFLLTKRAHPSGGSVARSRPGVFDSVAKDCLLVHARMLRLKQLTLVRSYIRSGRDDWESAKSCLCSLNWETLCYNRSYTLYRDDEFHEMVVEIKAATAAAAAEKNYYALAHSEAHATDELDEDKLHSFETDKDDFKDEDLGFLVNNMETLRNLCCPTSPLAQQPLMHLDDITARL
ncbi:hypothetical protein BG000_009525 [Podila horticola]|nr:hypothetical protein BG000_009525 [Podila horticola]